MNLKINFNNLNILRGYLEQALPQVGLESAKVTAGKEGGLVYLLFNDSDWCVMLQKQESSHYVK